MSILIPKFPRTFFLIKVSLINFQLSEYDLNMEAGSSNVAGYYDL